MKKLLLLPAFLLLIISCQKDDEPETTYQILNNSSKITTIDPYLDGTMWEVVVFCYAGEDIVNQDNINEIGPDGSYSEKINVTPDVTKIKVSFKLIGPLSDYYDEDFNIRKYIVAFTVIQKGKNNLVTLDGDTMIGNSLKSTSETSVALKNIFQF